MVPVLRPAAGSITVSVPDPLFATYATRPSGLIATPIGKSPTGTVDVTFPVTASITDTVSAAVLATSSRRPSGVLASPEGRSPTATVPANMEGLGPGDGPCVGPGDRPVSKLPAATAN